VGSPADTEASDTARKAGGCVLIEDSVQMVATKSSDTDNTSTLLRDFGHDRTYGSKAHLPVPEEVVSESLAAPGSLDRTRFPEGDIVEDTITGTSANLGASVSALHSPNQFTSEEPEIGRGHRPKKRSMWGMELSAEESDQIIQNLRDSGFLSPAQHGGGRTRHPYRIKDAATPSHSHPKTPIGKICSLFDKNGSASKVRAKQNSPFPDNDSGYWSGRATPSTLHSRDSLTSHPEALTEFGGLYRVACRTLHEPKRPDQHRETQLCHYCGCSSIHILAWSANRLNLQEFEAALKSKDPRDIQALDAAGNSALHYAAICGASYDHLRALIDAGVLLDTRNTANQNFLHMLRPCDAYTESSNVDCFKFGLIKLLELMKPRIDFGQQDNDGQTVLHVLASHITEPELREQTFE
jgi:hypothetical protein